MKFEIVERADEWIVQTDGEETARFSSREDALSDVAERLRETRVGETASLTVRFASKTA